jgi:hypothetical protein
MNLVELWAIPFCLVGLMVSWSRKEAPIAKWRLAAAVFGLAVTAILLFFFFTFDDGSV